MTTFSAKARQLIDDGVALLPPSQRKAWGAWTAAHPGTRQAGLAVAEARGTLPSDLAAIVLAALAAKAAQMRKLIEQPGLSEDAVSDLDNDLSHLRAVERSVRDGLATNRSAA